LSYANISSALNPAVEGNFVLKLSVTASCQFIFKHATSESFWTFWALFFGCYSKTGKYNVSGTGYSTVPIRRE